MIGIIFSLISLVSLLYVLSQVNKFAYRSSEFSLVMLLYIGMILLWLIAAVLLGKYASAIGRLRFSQSESDLATALDRQRAFWKFVGIITVIFTSVFIVFFLIGLTKPSYSGRF